jgi:hypothetical protein
MSTLLTSLEAQLSQVSASNVSGAAQIEAQLQSAQSSLTQAIQSGDTTQADQIAAQLQSVQTALVQLMVAGGNTTGLLSTTA